MTKTDLKTLIAKGKTAKVIAFLEKIMPQISEKELQDNIILQTARFNRLVETEKNGRLTDKDASVERNRINHALLAVIDELPTSIFEENNTTNKRSLKKYAAIFITLITVLAGLSQITELSLIDAFSKKTTEETPTAVVPTTDTLAKKVPEKQNIDTTKQKTKTAPKPPKQKAETPKPTIKAVQNEPQNTLQPTTKTTQGNTTSFNNTTVNGQVINNPSAPINIQNDYRTNKDTLKK